MPTFHAPSELCFLTPLQQMPNAVGREAAMTNPGWLFLPVGAGVELALASASVHRVLHSGSPDFAGYSHEAVDLAAFLGLPQDPALPQVVVVLNTGAAWRVGDAALQREGETLRFLALSPE